MHLGLGILLRDSRHLVIEFDRGDRHALPMDDIVFVNVNADVFHLDRLRGARCHRQFQRN